MKKITNTFLFVILINSIAAQVPDYLGNNPQWRETLTFGGAWPCLQIYDYIYYLAGDSTVDNHTYKKVFVRGEVDYQWMAPPPSVFCDEDFGYNYLVTLIRQDSLKMFLYDSDGNEYLLYDFDLAVGDTLPTTWNHPDWMPDIIITSIDSILVRDSYRKIFNLSESGWPLPLIEGIGYGEGFLEEFPAPEFPALLLCFTLNDTTYYPSYGAPCDLTVNIPLLDIDEKVKSYPNPAFDKLTIKLPVSLSINQVVACNIIGGETILPFVQNDLRTIEVDVSKLKLGLYILKLKSGNADMITLKMVKN